MASFSHYRVENDLQTPILEGTTDLQRGVYAERLASKLRIEIISANEDDVVFDLVGVETPIANALRRIMLAEVPTIAIENVWMSDNTSIIQDEVLAHRVGLIPIKADPNQFEYCQGDIETDQDTIIFHLEAWCPNPPPDVDPMDFKVPVHSSQLKWRPVGDQEQQFPEGIRPVNDDIVIAILKPGRRHYHYGNNISLRSSLNDGPGQHIEFEAHCRKGLGKDHAKFSPVATASYRLLPDISFKQPVTGELATQLKEMCPLDVFDIEDLGGTPTATVARPRDCTMCRECIRQEGWADRVLLRRVADHFIFTVESTGCIPPVEIVKQAIGVLKGKASKFKEEIGLYEQSQY